MFRHGGGGGEAGSVGWWGAEEEDEYEEDGGSRHGCSSGDRDMEREIYRNQFVQSMKGRFGGYGILSNTWCACNQSRFSSVNLVGNTSLWTLGG